MFRRKEPPIVISIGGSLVAPASGVDTNFLKKLNAFVREQVGIGKRFFLVTGGGKPARDYRDAGKEVIGTLTSDDLDWLGIHATHLNAHLLRTIFKDIAHPRIVQNYDKKLSDWREPVVVGAGWKPGWSSDYDAVLLAQDYGAQLIINLSNIDWVYDKDPNKYPDAKPIKKMTWEEMKKLVGDKWVPGMNAPFDPIAAQLAEKLNLTVVVANGKDFKNLEKIVSGEAFNGTVIMPYRIDASYFDKDYYSGKKGQYRIANSSFLGTGIIWLLQMYRALLIKVFLNPKTCLDVGAGTGGLVKALRTFGIDAKGIEYSKDALDMVPADIKPHILYGDINKIPFEDSSFDLVLTFDVLEHIDRSKIRKAIDETARVAKKFIYHKVYTKENTWINNFHKQDFSHISVFDKKYWTRLFTENEQLSIPRQSFFRLPSFFETVFILKKK